MSVENNELTIQEKMKFVIDGLKSGLTREQIAKSLGYGSWRGIDSMFRRRGYFFKDGMYVQREAKVPLTLDLSPPNPIRIALNQLKKGEKDLSLIAKRAGFTNSEDFTEYMKGHGWLWNVEKGTYVKDRDSHNDLAPADNDDSKLQLEIADQESRLKGEGCDQEQNNPFDRYKFILQFLDENLENLKIILKGLDSGGLPHYSFHVGNVITKSVSMSSNLDLLIRDFSAEKGISQRLIFEGALIQFMQKYGYSKEVQMLLDA